MLEILITVAQIGGLVGLAMAVAVPSFILGLVAIALAISVPAFILWFLWYTTAYIITAFRYRSSDDNDPPTGGTPRI